MPFSGRVELLEQCGLCSEFLLTVVNIFAEVYHQLIVSIFEDHLLLEKKANEQNPKVVSLFWETALGINPRVYLAWLKQRY